MFIGEVISADTSDIFEKCGDGTFSYQWQRDGVDIPGADSSNYRLVEADVDRAIRVVTTYVDLEGTIETFVSGAAYPAAAPEPAPEPAAPAPTAAAAAPKAPGRKRYLPKTFTITPDQIAALEARAREAYLAGQVKRPDVSLIVRQLLDDALGTKAA